MLTSEMLESVLASLNGSLGSIATVGLGIFTVLYGLRVAFGLFRLFANGGSVSRSDIIEMGFDEDLYERGMYMEDGILHFSDGLIVGEIDWYYDEDGNRIDQ